MTWWTENPVPILVFCVAAIAIIAIAFLQTGRKWCLYAGVAVVLLAASALVVDQVVITDREQIEITLRDLADLVGANDVPGVLAHIAADATRMRNDAERYLTRYQIERASIGQRIVVEIHERQQPPMATAEFTGRIEIPEAQEMAGRSIAVRKFRLQLRKEGPGDWRCVDYEMMNPLGN